MFLLQEEAGLALLLASAVLFGLVTLGAVSFARARRAIPPSVRPTGRTDGYGLVAGLANGPPARSSRTGDDARQGRQSEAARIVSRAAVTAPTDAHMYLRVGFEALRLVLRRLLHLHS
jgi:hypothetical protein